MDELIKQTESQLVSLDGGKEIQAALVIAASRPRNTLKAVEKILNACQRVRLAENALYQYARGGSKISGPSIRLAECIAQYWGNMNFGFRELENKEGKSTVEAFAWDLENNTKRSVIFTVEHKRYTRKGVTFLNDPRDIYENVANQASRRVRACILAIVPGDVIEEAVDQCEKTLQTNLQLNADNIKKMLDKFLNEFGVERRQIEQKIQSKINAIAPAQFIALRNIYNSLKNEMSSPLDWFEPLEEEKSTLLDEVNK